MTLRLKWQGQCDTQIGCEAVAEGLGTLKPLPTEALAIPPLSLAGRLPEQHNAIINLDLTAATPAPGGGAAADFTAWPEFHNGVAAGANIFLSGLRLCSRCSYLRIRQIQQPLSFYVLHSLYYLILCS